MRVWKFGDNINTDLITPGRYNITIDEKRLGQIAFIEFRPEFSLNIEKGDIIVAGKNFGCGSSREHAPISLKAAGVQAVFAESFARIFYRNCINIGLHVFICNNTHKVDDGDKIQVDLINGIILDETKNIEIQGDPLPTFIQKIVSSGGLIDFLRGDGYV
ncbi:3-isopropylmalate dehydratase small subunit [Candidatus Bathyarchaeota archaeon]|nr:3-isopropylmalate dehydratase small subunit [Candidatus Bathyarchaeota archaeon]